MIVWWWFLLPGVPRGYRSGMAKVMGGTMASVSPKAGSSVRSPKDYARGRLKTSGMRTLTVSMSNHASMRGSSRDCAVTDSMTTPSGIWPTCSKSNVPSPA